MNHLLSIIGIELKGFKYLKNQIHRLAMTLYFNIQQSLNIIYQILDDAEGIFILD
jgi:hypothetical protein